MPVKTMTPKQRLLAAMRCEQTDRVPIQVRGVYPTETKWLAQHHESYRPLFELVRDRCDPVHNVGFGGGWHYLDRAALDIREETVPFDSDWKDYRVTVATPKGPLVQVIRVSLKGNSDYCVQHFINSAEDIEKFLSLKARAATPNADAWFETVKRVGDHALPLAFIGMNPVGMVHELMGSETLAILSATDRGALMELLRTLARRWCDFAGGILDLGVSGVFSTLGHEVALPPLQSPADFHEFVVETDLETMRMIRERGSMVHVHCHSNLNKSLVGFVTLGINCLHPIEAPPMGDIELAEAKRRLAGKICIEGNLQIGELMTSTPDEIRRTTRKIIEDAGAGGGLILCPTASPHWPMLSDKVLANYRAFIETAREFGGY